MVQEEEASTCACSLEVGMEPEVPCYSQEVDEWEPPANTGVLHSSPLRTTVVGVRVPPHLISPEEVRSPSVQL